MGLKNFLARFRKRKLDQVTYDEVVDAIIDLEKREDECFKTIEENARKEEEFKQRIRTEKNNTFKLALASKISAFRNSSKRALDRLAYLIANVDLFEMVKERIRDNEFFGVTKGSSLMSMLADQAGLTKWLNQSLKDQSAMENALIRSKDTISSMEGFRQRPEEIYGLPESTSDIIAEIERESGDSENEEAVAKETMVSNKK